MTRQIRKSQRKNTFDAQAFLDSTSVSRKVAEFREREAIFRQGDPSIRLSGAWFAERLMRGA